MTDQSPELVTWIQRVGTLSFGTTLALILYGGYKRVWVWGSEYARLEKERDEWKSMALRHLGIAEKATSIAAAPSAVER